jgi:hypothetical protein
MRFEEAQRHQRDFDALSLMASRERRLSRVVEENNLVIVDGGRTYVVLSGRLARQAELDSPQAARDVTAFVADNYGRYRGHPIAREELEPMLVVSRWLRERSADEGRLIFLDGPVLPIQALIAHCGQAADPNTAVAGPTES